VIFSVDPMKTNANLIVTVIGGLALLGSACRPPPTKSGGRTGTPVEAAPAPQMGHNLLFNEGFGQGARSLPWNGQISTPAEGKTFVEGGELCLELKQRGANRWDAQLRHQHILLQQNHTYTVQFKMHATTKTRGYIKVGQAGPPYREFWKLLFDIDETPRVYSGTFKMLAADDPSVEFAIHLGGQLARLAPVPFKVCLDDVRLDDPEFVQKPEPAPPPIKNVLVNQVGYFPTLTKIATVKNPNAVPWELRNAAGQAVASGTTIPHGPDPASGDKVSIVDFSSYGEKGTGFSLKVGADVSHPFDIRDDLYSKLKYDALAFFYQQRSGIPIEMPYAGDPSLARPAGHIDVKPNIGDKSVPCGVGTGCDYRLDVSGGWYDAGDHGKYVVNAGISVWTLLNWWERTQILGSSAAEFGDGKMNIPEHKNKVPDLLDEARWELEFELKMQVPEGEKLAGMAHHKIHDAKWTQLSLGPHEDPMPRFLRPPSTAATLNLAANGAQCARIWRTIDKAFAEKCLKAGERAWEAARANPTMLAAKQDDGGGPYDDDKLADDFYWAAAELFITTKKPVYKDFVTKSEFYKKVEHDWTDNTGMRSSMTWGDTDVLGTLSLMIAPNGLGKDEIDSIKKALVERANLLVDVTQKEGYRLPFGAPKKGYPWGSTSFVVNNAIILALAYDVSRDARFLNNVALAMDYILGRNAIDQSYVTGYGDRPLENPYHRFWCYQANNKYPKPPPGVLSGGANSGLDDPYSQGAGLQNCAPQKCFLDHGEAWSTNEVTINWNAPLAWVAAWLDEKAGPKSHAPKGKGK
jgi:endoglucanase